MFAPAAPAAAAEGVSAPPARALELRNLGIAELENEQPEKAEEIFRELAAMLPEEPLPHANLAIAHLRQQEFEDANEAIRKALRRAPERPDLLAIRAEIASWNGDIAAAVETLRTAAAADPTDVEIQYALHRHAVTLGDAGQAAAGEALGRLERLRPENLVVLLARGREAIGTGDRAAATKAFLRIDELIWGAPEGTEKLLEPIRRALEEDRVADARVPAIRLENVLKVTPMYRESLRELSTGIQGIPIERFETEPPVRHFGEPLDVVFRGRRLDGAAATAVAAGDFDGDGRSDLAWAGADSIRLAGGEPTPSGAEVAHLLAADIDNDGHLELIAATGSAVRVFAGADGSFEDRTVALGLAGVHAETTLAVDFDIEGDLDLVTGGRGLDLHRAVLGEAGTTFEPVGALAFRRSGIGRVTALAASDLDRDGDLDLLVAHEGGIDVLDNLRQGEFERVARLTDLAAPTAVRAIDLDNDGFAEIVAAGRGLAAWTRRGTTYEPLQGLPRTGAEFTALEPFDADNDGRIDLAIAGEGSLTILQQRADGGFGFLPVEGGPKGALDLIATDVDADGDLDLAAASADGVWVLDNDGGNRNHWLSVRLRGLDKGNSKNNTFGVGSVVEVRAGNAYQFREATADATHFGLGSLREADLLRVVWTNGVPQNRTEPTLNQTIVEEQLLKGSCPFLYAWNGERMEFVTDLLWASPAGLPLAPGVWAGADPSELVRVRGAVPREGRYQLSITEELWEAAFFDHVRLWVVDTPIELETATALRITGAPTPERVLATADVRPLAAAIDASGQDATERVARRDHVYADGWNRSRWQGVADRLWTFTMDLGEAPAAPVRLLLDGWIFPTDASLNIALGQRTDSSRAPTPVPPRLEIERVDAAGRTVWTSLMDNMGFPAGKTKTMVVDTPPLPPGVSRLRIVAGQWLSWDRIAWSTSPRDDAPVVVDRLLPAVADLDFRGYSALVRRAPNAPHEYDYAVVSREAPWLPFPGRYSRYGDTLELLREPDDRSAILAAGDELRLEFDASHLGPPPPGHRREVFLESHGWDKDADRNTWEPQHLEPLPFRAMSGYPYGDDERFPDGPLHRTYRERWLTREIRNPVGR